MPRFILALAVALVLPGCLTSKEPAFDATNSLPVGEIPEFLAVADAWEGYVTANGSPRELIAEGARGIVVDGIVVVQEHNDYYAMAMMGGRPMVCVIYAQERIGDVAKAQGVTVEVAEPESGSIDDQPVNVTADGPRDALATFVRDQFANQRIACLGHPRGG